MMMVWKVLNGSPEAATTEISPASACLAGLAAAGPMVGKI